MGQVFVRASKRAKAYYRGGVKKAKKLKSAIFKMKQTTATHNYVLYHNLDRGTHKELRRLEVKARRVDKILKVKRARGFRTSAYR